jgi:cytochrome c peroxidase
MNPPMLQRLWVALSGLVVTGGVGCVDQPSDTSDSLARRHEDNSLKQDQRFENPFGVAATFSTTGSVRLDGEFFTSFGTNGRTCGSCHQPSDGWTVIPSHIQQRFNATGGTDPIFRLVDGSNRPDADVSSVSKRRTAYSMLLNKGLIRIGIGVPLVNAAGPNKTTAEFELAAADDPYHFASAAQLSLFRRPLPTANIGFLSTIMWDGRETAADPTVPATFPDSNCLKPNFAPKCFRSIDFDLNTQANDATLGHAQAEVPGLTSAEERAIVDFEDTLFFAQIRDEDAGRLDHRGALGGPDNIATEDPYFGKNDNFGDYRTGAPFTAVIFSLYDAWATDGDDDDHDNEGWDRDRRRQARESIARGQALFNSKQITISGVGGLNGVLGLPTSFSGTCGTCHDMPNGGNHTVPAPLNIGLTDEVRRTPDMPLYTMRCSAVGEANGHCTHGQTVKTTDPGRALITGNWADIGKFKGPVLRGLAARAPYFHNGLAANLGEAVDFYDTRFGIGFTAREREDLVAFLQTL